MFNAIQSRFRNPARSKSALFAALAILFGISLPAHAAKLKYFGGNLAWLQYGSTFGSAYNSSTMNTYLTEFQSNNLNFVRVWACEGLDGLSFDGSGNCTGISQTNLNNIRNFASLANGKGITVEFVFLNYMDVQKYPNLLENSSNMNSLVNNALVPLGRTIQPYNAQIDLINEGNVATNVVSWNYIRPFCQTAVSALHNAGVYRWITMSDQYSADFTSYFNSSVGGLGFDFYEYHDYNSDGSINVSAGNVGNAPLEMNEFGPGSGWNNYAYTTDKNVLGSFLNNAQNQGYYGAAFWCYINDSNFQLRGNTLMGDMSWWGSYFGT
jgi:hypothetical protein